MGLQGEAQKQYIVHIVNDLQMHHTLDTLHRGPHYVQKLMQIIVVHKRKMNILEEASSSRNNHILPQGTMERNFQVGIGQI